MVAHAAAMWDLAIVGAGAAGIAAAIESAERGLRVIVIEAHCDYGGAARLSGAGCCVAGTPLQARLGIRDSVDLAYADWLRAGGPSADRAWARYYLEHAVEDLYLWAERRGVRWAGVKLEQGNSAPRWHHPELGGPELMGALYAHARGLRIDWRFGTPVTGLVEGDGAIRGVELGGRGGGSVATGAVIMATGGFSNDPVLLARYLPPLPAGGRYLRGGAPQATGSGHRLLANVGATFAALNAICLYPVGTPHPDDPTHTRGVSVVGITNIWVNREGERFHDESRRGMADTSMLIAQPGSTSWGIFDNSQVDRIAVGGDPHYKAGYGGSLDIRARVRGLLEHSPFIHRAGSLADLARAVGLPPARVVGSVARFNEAIRHGDHRDEFGRDLRGLRPIEVAPFHAIQYFPWVQKCLGGVVTDLDCRVLRPDGSRVAGLYAAGELAGMAGGHINGHGTLEGTMIGPSLLAGRVAARSVALAQAASR